MPETETVVLLHGFGGTSRAWDGVAALLPAERYRPVALDLPGHGEEGDARRPITFAGCVAHVLARVQARAGLAPPREDAPREGAPRGCVPSARAPSPETGFTLCGYSLGGRVALHVALAAPERVRRLVLVSTGAGIEDGAGRAARRVADADLAVELERAAHCDVAEGDAVAGVDGAAYERFVERWRSQPLFAGEPPAAGVLARADQLRNRPEALAAVLRGIGAGEMEPLWNRLPDLGMPVTVLAGERDAKYRALGERMARLLPRGELRVVPGGHGLPLENPAAVAEALL